MSGLDASMASMGLGNTGATPLANAAFGSRISNTFSGVNSAIQQMVTGLTKAAKLTAQIKKDTADISKALGHSFGSGGVGGVLGTGGVGAGSSMNLGLAAVSGGGGSGMGGATGLAGFGGAAGGPAGAAGISSTLLKLGYAKAGLGAAAGLAQMALAPGVAAYGMMPATSDVLMRNRLMFNASLGSGMMANSLAQVVTSSTFGRMGSTMDGYQAAATLSGSGYGVNSSLGRNMLRTAGGLSYLTGGSGADIAGTLAGNVGSPQVGNRLRTLGIATVSSNGDPMSFSQVGNQVYSKMGFSGLSETQIQRELRPGMSGNLNLGYYFQDPQMKALIQQYILLRARNGGKPVDMSSNSAMSAISAAGGGVLGADKSLRQYAGTSSNMIEAFGSSISGGIQTGANIASNVNNAAVDNAGLLQGVARLKGSIDTLAGTSAGQGLLAGAATGLKGFADVLKSATVALAMYSIATAGSGAAGGIAGKLGMSAKAGSALGVAGGVLGGIGAGAAGIGVTEALRSHFADSSVGNGSAWQTAGTIAGYAGSGAAAGALIGSVVPGPGTAIGAVAGTVLGAGLGIWRTVQGGGASGAGGGTGGATSVSGGNSTSLLSLAKRFVGTPYVWGGTSPRGWDCSGFTQYVFGKIGVRLGRTTYDQAKQGTQVPYSKAKPGDLLFYHYAQDSQGGINHVAIYLGGGRQVAAANRRTGTVIQSVDTKNLVMVRRVLGGELGKSSNSVADDNNSVGSTTGSSAGYQTSALGTTQLTTGVSGISAHLTSVMDMLQSGGVAVATDGGTNNASGSGSSSGDAGSKISGSGSSSASGDGKGMVSYLRKAGFKGSALTTAYAVMMAESRGNAHAHNPVPPDNSYGLFQINMLGGMGPERRAQYHLSSNDALYDPLTNAKVAYSLSGGGKNWNPWSTFTSGSYKKYLSSAPSYSKGSWNVSKDQAANLHAGEMVLPASVAQAVRDNANKTLAGQGGSGASTGSGSVTINVYPASASDAEAITFGNKVKDVLDGKKRLSDIGSK